MKDLEKYFNFEGKAKRNEYWAVLALSSLLMVSTVILFLALSEILLNLSWFFILIVVVAGAIVQFAVIARRLRDIGINPWWTLAILIPYVDIALIIVFGCLESK